MKREKPERIPEGMRWNPRFGMLERIPEPTIGAGWRPGAQEESKALRVGKGERARLNVYRWSGA